MRVVRGEVIAGRVQGLYMVVKPLTAKKRWIARDAGAGRICVRGDDFAGGRFRR